MKIFHEKQEDNPWVSISDLMSVLMIIFLFISVTYMIHMSIEKKRIEVIAVTYEKLQQKLYNDLSQEFESDLKKWNAILDTTTLSIRFEQPEVLFESGSPVLQKNFQKILDDFFPRFISILTSDKYKNDIEEIRIEGHTSSEWIGEFDEKQAYFNNMELSQNRTRNVLKYVLAKEWKANSFSWIKNHITANGLSSSKPILNADNTENKEGSRRVEFRVRTNAEKHISTILNKTDIR